MTTSRSDPIAAFRDAICGAGLPAPEVVIGDGRIHRFSSNGKRSNTSGWYKLHLDGRPAGAFGCWRSGISETWRHGRNYVVHHTTSAGYRESVASLKRAPRRRTSTPAVEAAEALLAASHEADETHPYLKAKRVQNYGLRELDGVLLVPMRDEFDNLHNVQRIYADGRKLYLKGCVKSGMFFRIGDDTDPLVIVEGYATGATIYEALGYCTVIAFDCGNLEPVAHRLRRVHPRHKFIFAADNDRHTDGNPGVTKATDAAQKHGGVVIPPPFRDADDGSDWNDFEAIYGLEGVEQLREH